MGIARSQSECEVLCKTTGTSGTPPKNLARAIEALDRKPTIIKESRPEVAVLFLDAWLREGRSAALCVDNYTHWVAAVGLCGKRILIADPADNELVISLSRQELLDRWVGEGRTAYYGVVL